MCLIQSRLFIKIVTLRKLKAILFQEVVLFINDAGRSDIVELVYESELV